MRKRARASPKAPFDLHLYPIGGSSANWRDGRKWRLGIGLLEPRSRGRVLITSLNPGEPPRVEATHLFDPSDRDVDALADGIDLARAIAGSRSLKRSIGHEVDPGETARDDVSIRKWIRCHLTHYHHPVGTCRMGLATDEMAVVDAAGTVFGTVGLTVADCSVMPSVPRGNTNAPAAAVALGIAESLEH